MKKLDGKFKDFIYEKSKKLYVNLLESGDLFVFDFSSKENYFLGDKFEIYLVEFEVYIIEFLLGWLLDLGVI